MFPSIYVPCAAYFRPSLAVLTIVHLNFFTFSTPTQYECFNVLLKIKKVLCSFKKPAYASIFMYIYHLTPVNRVGKLLVRLSYICSCDKLNVNTVQVLMFNYLWMEFNANVFVNWNLNILECYLCLR